VDVKPISTGRIDVRGGRAPRVQSSRLGSPRRARTRPNADRDRTRRSLASQAGPSATTRRVDRCNRTRSSTEARPRLARASSERPPHGVISPVARWLRPTRRDGRRRRFNKRCEARIDGRGAPSRRAIGRATANASADSRGPGRRERADSVPSDRALNDRAVRDVERRFNRVRARRHPGRAGWPRRKPRRAPRARSG
jgi:hypothetical protein